MATLNVEEWALKSIILNTADMKVPDSLKASASDMYGRGIDLHVTQGGEPADMTDMDVYLFWRHRNGNQDATTFEEIDASTGHFRLYYPPAMMYPGEVLARIAIYIGSEKLTGSLNFIIRVEPNPVNEDEAMACESFRTFLEAVEALSSLEETVAANEEERKANEEERKANEDARIAAEEERIAAEEERKANETERQSNEETRQENEETREGNEEERTSEWEKLKEEIQAATDAANAASGLELPLAIEYGGTGLTSAPSMLTNLESTTAESPFQASPRPGVTGTLPLGNGGTGGTTAATARSNLEVYSTSEVDSLLSNVLPFAPRTVKYDWSIGGSSSLSDISIDAYELTVVPWTASTSSASSDYFTSTSNGNGIICQKTGLVLIIGSLYYANTSATQFGSYIYLNGEPGSNDGFELTGCFVSPNGAGVQCVCFVPVDAGTSVYHVARANAAATVKRANSASFLEIAYLSVG